MRFVEVTVKTIAEGHERVVRDILKYGEELTTEDGELTIEWPPHDPYVIHVTEPFTEPMASDVCMFGRHFLDEYVTQLLTLHPPSDKSATYYYSNRLFDYPLLRCDVEEPWQEDPYYYVGDGNGDGLNQVYYSIIKRLAESPNSRRAIAITWVPEMDVCSGEPPCLQLVQCFIRDQTLHMTCYFRSNDMLSAWGANAYGLTYLMKYVCDEINKIIYEDGIRSGLCDCESREDCISVGTLTTISSSAHIYWKRDQSDLLAFRRKLNV